MIDQHDSKTKMPLEITDNVTLLPAYQRKSYEDLLTDILIALVSHPYDVEVLQMKNEECLHFEVYAKQEDHGQIIGKKGTTIGALCKVFTAISRGRPIKIDLKACNAEETTESD